MKKQLLTLASMVAISFLSITGCKKEKNAPAPPAPTKTDLLTQSSWKFDHATASGIDISSQINACFKDNIATFTANGNMTLDEGTTVCSPTSYAGSYQWSFQSAESILRLSQAIFTGGNTDFTIVLLNSSNMTLSQPMTVNSITATVEVTFKH